MDGDKLRAGRANWTRRHPTPRRAALGCRLVPHSPRLIRLAVVATLVSAALLAAAFALSHPLFGVGGDEMAHFDYAYQVWHGRLPVFELGPIATSTGLTLGIAAVTVAVMAILLLPRRPRPAVPVDPAPDDGVLHHARVGPQGIEP